MRLSSVRSRIRSKPRPPRFLQETLQSCEKQLGKWVEAELGKWVEAELGSARCRRLVPDRQLRLHLLGRDLAAPGSGSWPRPWRSATPGRQAPAMAWPLCSRTGARRRCAAALPGGGLLSGLLEACEERAAASGSGSRRRARNEPPAHPGRESPESEPASGMADKTKQGHRWA